MTTKNYLQQISRLDRLINNKMIEIQQYRDMACSIKSPSTEERVQSTPDFDKIGNSIAKLDELERKLDEVIDKYVDEKQVIIAQIESMDNEMYYQVLFAKYICKKTFEKIAADCGYSFRQILRVHGRALQDFEKKYGEIYLDR